MTLIIKMMDGKVIPTKMNNPKIEGSFIDALLNMKDKKLPVMVNEDYEGSCAEIYSIEIIL